MFFKGCPLSCYWCSNPESQDNHPCKEARQYIVEEVLELCLQDRAFYEETRGGVTFSGGEPLSQQDFLIELSGALRKEKIHIAIETSGFAPLDIFSDIYAAIDLLLFDIKHYDDSLHVMGTGVHFDEIIANLRSAISFGKELLIRIPVIPRYNNTVEDARGFCSLLESLGIYQVQLLPFHQFGGKKYELLGLSYSMKNIPQLHAEDLEEYQMIFTKAGIKCFF